MRQRQPEWKKQMHRLARSAKSKKQTRKKASLPVGWLLLLAAFAVFVWKNCRPDTNPTSTQIIADQRQREFDFLKKSSEQFSLVYASPGVDVFRHRLRPRRFTVLGDWKGAASVAEFNSDERLSCCVFHFTSAHSLIVDTERMCEPRIAQDQIIQFFEKK